MRTREGAYTFVRVDGRDEEYEVWRGGAKLGTFIGPFAKIPTAGTA